jgi:hypothetical protein
MLFGKPDSNDNREESRHAITVTTRKSGQTIMVQHIEVGEIRPTA